MKFYFRDVRSGKRRAALADLRSIVRKEIEEAMDRQVKPAIVKAHEKIVVDWEHKVEFAARKILGNVIAVYVFPTGENKKIWLYVDQGTEPHVIRPVKVKLLSFVTGYQPKTLAKPARTVIGGGGHTGERVFAKEVQHPGNEGRFFSEQIAEEMRDPITAVIEAAFRRAARAAEE